MSPSSNRPLSGLNRTAYGTVFGPRERCGHDEAPLREAPWLDAHGCSAVTRAATLHAVDGLTTSTALTVDTWRRGPEHLQRHYLLQHAPVVVTTIQQTPVASCALSAGFCVSESLGRCNERSELGKAGRRHSFCLLPPSCPGTCLHALVKRPGHHPILSFYIAHALIKVLDAFPTYIYET